MKNVHLPGLGTDFLWKGIQGPVFHCVTHSFLEVWSRTETGGAWLLLLPSSSCYVRSVHFPVMCRNQVFHWRVVFSSPEVSETTQDRGRGARAGGTNLKVLYEAPCQLHFLPHPHLPHSLGRHQFSPTACPDTQALILPCPLLTVPTGGFHSFSCSLSLSQVGLYQSLFSCPSVPSCCMTSSTPGTP